MTISSALLFARAPAPWPRWSLHAQRRVGGFGLPAALAGLVEVMFRNVDYVILAARLSATTTGIYYRAFNLGVVYQDKLSGVMVQVAYPVYSRTTDRAKLRAVHERAARVHAAIIFPLLASLMVLAPVLVPFLFGSRLEALGRADPGTRPGRHAGRRPHRLLPGDARDRPPPAAARVQRRPPARLRRRGPARLPSRPDGGRRGGRRSPTW